MATAQCHSQWLLFYYCRGRFGIVHCCQHRQSGVCSQVRSSAQQEEGGHQERGGDPAQGEEQVPAHPVVPGRLQEGEEPHHRHRAVSL